MMKIGAGAPVSKLRHLLAKKNSTFFSERPNEMMIDLSHGEDGKG